MQGMGWFWEILVSKSNTMQKDLGYEVLARENTKFAMSKKMEMRTIYLDNAATTEMRDEVKEKLHHQIEHSFGNPSAIYSCGREAKNGLEMARKDVSRLLNARPGEIFFTSGGTEATNTALQCSVMDAGVKRIVTSPIEHAATLKTAKYLAEHFDIDLQFVKLNEKGEVDLDSLADILDDETKTIVTLMHANNEIGNLTDPVRLGEICDKPNVFLHMDMVQTIGHYPIDLESLKVDMASGSSHKYHGPKGVGLLYVNRDITIKPLIIGGAQERNMRAGTENTIGITGLAQALKSSTDNMQEEEAYILGLKKYALDKIQSDLPEAIFHGNPFGASLYTVINIGLPKSDKTEMLNFYLDTKGICVSGGSACSSGIQSSHVISAIYGEDHPYAPIRISFSKNNVKEDVDAVVTEIKNYLFS